MRHAQGAQRAFTLIELLVVISIVAILAGILFPVFAQAKAIAKQIACMVQMRQMATAIHIYMADHDDTWCPAVGPSDIGPDFAPQQPWMGYDNNNAPLAGGFYGRIDQEAINRPRPGAIEPYVKSEGVKRCPAMPTEWQSSYAMNWFNPNTPSAYYAVNPTAQGQEFGPGSMLMTTAPDGGLDCIGAPASVIEVPAETLVLWEHKARAPLCNWLQSGNWFESPPNDPFFLDHFHFLHRNGANSIFADTHARRMVYSQLRRPLFSCLKSIYP